MSNILESRERLANGRFYTFKEKKDDKMSLEDREEGEEEEGHSKVLVTKCYSSIAVSSNERTLTKLVGGVLGVACWRVPPAVWLIILWRRIGSLMDHHVHTGSGKIVKLHVHVQYVCVMNGHSVSNIYVLHVHIYSVFFLFFYFSSLSFSLYSSLSLFLSSLFLPLPLLSLSLFSPLLGSRCCLVLGWRIFLSVCQHQMTVICPRQ